MKKELGLKGGFTLAEVLITLGIIGVVAALTIPILVHDIQDNQFKVAYKKAYSVASQAWQSAYADNMLSARTGWCAGDASDYDNFNQFMTKFNVLKTCHHPSNGACWALNENTTVWGNDPFSVASSVCFLDKSGMSWCVGNCGRIYVDTNGFKLPNKYGIDRFEFDSHVGSADVSVAGIPSALKPRGTDYTSKDDTYCPNGNNHPCYYTKWLYN